VARGRHTNDGVYRLLVRHALQPKEGASAAVLLDIKTAFENVRRDQLVHAARKSGYPMRWLRLSLPSYAWHRTLVAKHAAGSTVHAHVGIGTGAMSAPFELHLYVLGLIHAHRQAYPCFELVHSLLLALYILGCTFA
jgi:hypothetical protein